MAVRTIDGRAIGHYKDFGVRESGLAPLAEPLYKEAISDGIAPNDFIMDGLVLYLPLHSLRGSKFKSVDRYQHTCTVSGALWRPNGRWFDGDNDVITVPNHSALSGMTAFTLEVWMRSDGDAGALNGLMSKYGAAGNAREWLVGLDDDLTKIECRIYDDSEDKYIGRRDTTSNVWDDVAHHIVAVWDGTAASSGIDIYVDGSETDDTDDESGGFLGIEALTSDIKVGTRAHEAQWYKNYIGEVRIYNRALSLAEITHNRNATKWRYA